MAFAYVFKTGPNHYKIGRTKDIEKRRKELSTGNPSSLELVDAIETDHDSLVENFLQKKFSQFICETGDSTEHYEMSLDILKNGMKEARDFLSGYLPVLEESKRYSECDISEPSKEPTEDMKKIIKDLRSVRGKIDILEFEQTYLENQLKVLIGQAEGINGMVTWKSQLRTSFDQQEFKIKHPDIFAEFSKEVKSRMFRLVK